MPDYLLPIADREPLLWIVREQRTAFAEHRAAEAVRLERGDRLFLYSTRGCFRSPTRDRGRVIACASVAAPARRLEEPVRFADREYPYLVELEIGALASFREGVDLAPLVPKLSATFPDPRSWSVRLRRALVPFAPADADLIAGLLAAVVRPYEEARATYGDPAAGGCVGTGEGGRVFHVPAGRTRECEVRLWRQLLRVDTAVARRVRGKVAPPQRCAHPSRTPDGSPPDVLALK